MVDLEGSVEIGEMVVGVCSGCEVEGNLRYDGFMDNPVKKTRIDMYTCMNCETTRGYNKRAILSD